LIQSRSTVRSVMSSAAPISAFVIPPKKRYSTMRASLADRVMAATNHELAEQTRLRATEDFKEGVKATEERRAANFRGR